MTRCVGGRRRRPTSCSHETGALFAFLNAGQERRSARDDDESRRRTRARRRRDRRRRLDDACPERAPETSVVTISAFGDDGPLAGCTGRRVHAPGVVRAHVGVRHPRHPAAADGRRPRPMGRRRDGRPRRAGRVRAPRPHRDRRRRRGVHARGDDGLSPQLPDAVPALHRLGVGDVAGRRLAADRAVQGRLDRPLHLHAAAMGRLREHDRPARARRRRPVQLDGRPRAQPRARAVGDSPVARGAHRRGDLRARRFVPRARRVRGERARRARDGPLPRARRVRRERRRLPRNPARRTT